MAVADEYCSTQPREPQPHGAPFGSTQICPISPAVPSTPRSIFPFKIIPPPTPVPSVTQTELLTFFDAPSQCSPIAAALASFSKITGKFNASVTAAEKR